MHHSEGVPFFVAELLRALFDDGSLRRGPEGWTFDGAAGVGVPPLLQQVVERRLMQLPDGHRDTYAPPR